MRSHTIIATAGLVATAAAAQRQQFSIHDDLLAFPQFKVAFPDSFILEADAQSKLDFASSISSAKAGSQTAHSSPADNAPSTRTQATGQGTHSNHAGTEDLPQAYEYVVLDSKPYLCSIPQVEDDRRNASESAASEADDRKELDRARARGSELIGEMNENCLYYISGWWSYSFCYNSEVKQFHQRPPGRNGVPIYPPIEDRAVPSYVLGQYIASKPHKAKGVEAGTVDDPAAEDSAHSTTSQKATDLVEVQSKGSLKYLVQKLDDGTTCDLTGRPRRIEVQYHCDPGAKDRISWIKEISTCSYLMMVYTSRLCDDVAFSPPQENDAHQIVCREIVSEENVEAWKSQRENRRTAEKVGEAIGKGSADDSLLAGVLDALAPTDAQVDPGANQGQNKPNGVVIGGIELGGMKTVGMPGRRLEPPQAFAAPTKDGANKVDVIVQFDPKKNDGNWMTLSDKDLRRLGVDPKDAREMAEDMYTLYTDRRWRIEIAHTSKGDELRGIIDGDEEDSKPKKKEGEPQEGSEEDYYQDEL